jgi:DNA ligase (NAD+)
VLDNIDKLIEELESASVLYYQTAAESSLSDEEYDLKLDFLKDLQQKDRLDFIQASRLDKLVNKVASGTSPSSQTPNVNEDVPNDTLSKLRPKVEHRRPMLSLNKAQTLEEVDEYLTRTAKFGADVKGWILQAKLDGIAISAQYFDGVLEKIVSRGNGAIGEDLSDQLPFIKSGVWTVAGLPLELPPRLTTHSENTSSNEVELMTEIRGEMLMTDQQFEALNDIRRAEIEEFNERAIATNKERTLKNTSLPESKKLGMIDLKDFEKEKYKHSRNAVSGLLNSKPGESDPDPAGFSFFAYGGFIGDSQIDVKDLKSAGFLDATSMTSQCLRGPDSEKNTEATSLNAVHQIIDDFGALRADGKVPFPTDGIVVKCVEDARISAEMGSTAHHPSSQIAYKYPPLGATTTILDIETNVGRTGRLSFRAKTTPVVIDGITIQYATLHNYDWLHEKDARVGSLISLVRANDVIPYVAAILSNPADSTAFPEPETCPLCDADLDKSTLLVRCPNEECESRGQNALFTAVSRKYLNVEYMSKELLYDLLDSELVEDLADIFTLSWEDLATLKIRERESGTKAIVADMLSAEKDGEEFDRNIYLGEVMASKIWESIQRAKQSPLHKILASLNIRMLGLEVAKVLAKKYKTIDALFDTTLEDLTDTELVGPIKADIFYESLKRKRPLIEKLRDAGFTVLAVHDPTTGDSQTPFESSESETDTLPLNGDIVVISGSIPGYNRDEGRELVESLGAKSSGSVSSKTTLVIADPDSTSSKVVKAKDLGIKVISAADFLTQYPPTH